MVFKLEELPMGVCVLAVCAFLPRGILDLERNSSTRTRKEEGATGRGSGGGCKGAGWWRWLWHRTGAAAGEGVVAPALGWY